MEKSKKYWEKYEKLSNEWKLYEKLVKNVLKNLNGKNYHLNIEKRNKKRIEGILSNKDDELILETENKKYNLGNMNHATELFLEKYIYGISCFQYGEIKEMARYLENSLKEKGFIIKK
ncbi:MAG: hypothetical protein QW117_02040 [Candidatus Pacearchaeota archaeon]